MLIIVEATPLLLTAFCLIIGLCMLAFKSLEERSTALTVEELEKDNRIAALGQELSTTEERCKALEAANATLASSKESTNMELSQQLASKANELHIMATQIKDKDNTIANLNQHLVAHGANLSTAYSKTEALQNTLEAQSYDLADFSKLRATMEEEADAARANLAGTIHAFMGNISELQAEKAELQRKNEELATGMADLTREFELLVTGLYF
jgi:chromosome segregation ATPase